MYETTGASRVPDLNSGNILGYSEVTTSTYNGVRQWSGANYTFGPNVTLWSMAQATKVIIKGSRATDVEFLKPGNVSGKVAARKEVIVSCGVLGSPKLLLLR
jgi:choline dehydrogenase